MQRRKSLSTTDLIIWQNLDYLAEQGNLSRPPYTKHLSNGIFELRAKDRRFLFYYGPEREIIFVHSLVKKRNEVGEKEIGIAEKNRKLIQDGKEEVNDLEIQDDDCGKTEE